MANHYHDVDRTGIGYTVLPCYYSEDCPYDEATPLELGIWLESQDRSIPFKNWLRIHRLSPAVPADKSGIVVDQSVSDAIRESIRNPKTTRTVQVTVEKSDGSKWVVGHAEVAIEDGDVVATMELDRDCIAAHVFSHNLGKFSISTKGAPLAPANVLRAEDAMIPLEPRIKSNCLDPECMYMRAHHHGPACTSDCSCNRNGRVD